MASSARTFVHQPTILVVEDDENLLAGICDMLEVADYGVFSAVSGLDALDVLRSLPQSPSLIVSDIAMPFMDGYGLLNAVRQEREWMEIPFIFLTAYSEHEQIRSGMAAGADDYISKPFKADDLLMAIQAKLKRRSDLANVRALQIKEIKRNILTILNHEFRTPLSPVVAYADMIGSDPTALSMDELKLFLHGVNHGAQRLRRLVEDFMLLIELETGEAQTAYNFRRTLISNLGDMLHRVGASRNDAAIDKGLVLTVHGLPEDLPAFVADPEYLASAIGRLIDNAIKFTDESGKQVWLSAAASPNGDAVWISITDQGRGIPADQFGAIFDVFYQINREHYEDQGTGAGLAIVKAIMDLHNGKVMLESTVGIGSTFTLAVPAA